MFLLMPLVLWWANSPMRFASGPSRHWICAFVLSAIVATSSPIPLFADDELGDHQFSNRPANHDSKATRPSERHSSKKALREGSLVPPTDGRIVMVGRRWAFVPSDDKSIQELSTIALPPIDSSARNSGEGHFSDEPSTGSSFDVSSHSRRTNLNSATSSPRRMFGNMSIVATHAKIKADQDGIHLLLTENLMLQRIVEAIRADPSDNRWVVSGKITEFFDDNQLTIGTAKRSNSR